MTNKETLIQLYQEAKSQRLVLNQDEFAKKVGSSRVHLFKNMKTIPDEIIEKARELLKTKNVSGKTRSIVVEGNFNQLLGQRVATTAAIEAMLRTLRAKQIELEVLVTKRPYAEVALEFDRVAEDELRHILAGMNNES